MVRQLPPWHENLQKRQVKAPKVYVRDTGLLHQLLGLRTGQELVAHPKCGASWEGYAIEETLKLLQPDDAYFWATHNGAELDLLLFTRGRRLGVEVKRADAPTLTPSMRIALTDLRLDHLTVLYPGTKPYSLADRVSVVPLATLAEGRLGTLFPIPRRRPDATESNAAVIRATTPLVKHRQPPAAIRKAIRKLYDLHRPRFQPNCPVPDCPPNHHSPRRLPILSTIPILHNCDADITARCRNIGF